MSALFLGNYQISTVSTQWNNLHRVSTLITGQSPNEPKTHSVKYLRERVFDFVTGQLPNDSKIYSLKWLTQSVF